MANPPGYVSNNSGPVIPTGYEMLQGRAAQKRKLADALMAQGLAGPGSDARSWTQLLGSLAQAWAGKSLGKEADKIEGNIRNEQLGQYQTFDRAFGEDVKNKLSAPEMIARYRGNPYAGDRLKPWEDALAKGLENAQTFKDPVRLKGPDGKYNTYQPNAAGEYAPLPGGLQMAPKMDAVGQMVVALSEMAPGAVLPADPDATTIRNAKGEIVQNAPAVAAKTAIAAANASRIYNQFVNTGESEYAKKVGGMLGEQDTAAIQAARDAPQIIAGANRVLDLLKQNPITGTLAEQRLGLGKLLSIAGLVDGKTVANTEALASELAASTLDTIHTSGLGTGNGFTDKDRDFLQGARSGSITMTPMNLRHLAELRIRSAEQAKIKAKRVIERMRGNPATASMAQGFEAEITAGNAPASAAAPTPPQRTTRRAALIDTIMKRGQ